MVQLIVGKKGKGKTKQLLDKVNSEVKEISGSAVYLDKRVRKFELLTVWHLLARRGGPAVRRGAAHRSARRPGADLPVAA